MKHEKIRPPGFPQKADGAQARDDAASEWDVQTDDAVISEHITASGGLRGTGSVLIHGLFLGKIALNGTVTVARKGTVKGPIQADVIRVAGTVEGDITAKKCLHLEMTGSITGDVTVNSFVIEDGGMFNGRSKMTKSGEEPVIIVPGVDAQEGGV